MISPPKNDLVFYLSGSDQLAAAAKDTDTARRPARDRFKFETEGMLFERLMIDFSPRALFCMYVTYVSNRLYKFSSQ
jgi:hypothetical protein